MIDLRGHSALVTGASQGVGRAIAEAFARAGAHVLVHGRERTDAVEQVLANCRAFGVRCEFLDGELAGDPVPLVDDLFARAVALAPDLDILVNNAGTYIDKPFLEMD